MTLRENLERVRGRIAAAAARAGRPAAGVRLVAVTKSVDTSVIRALFDLGQRDFGENRVQALSARAGELGAAIEPPFSAAPDRSRPVWHMIGTLQRNKVRGLLSCSRAIHALNSLRLLDTIDAEAQRIGAVVDVLAELNVAGEEQKSGAALAESDALVAAAATRPGVRLTGLMTMAPLVDDPETARPVFARLRQLLESFQQRGLVGPDCRHLSMGMSNDFEVAIEEGATVVRVGSVLFEGLREAGSADAS